MIAPVAPIGWPRAMAPPFGLVLAGSRLSSWLQAQATLAAVDYITITLFGYIGSYAKFDNFLLVDSKAKIGNLIFKQLTTRDTSKTEHGN